MTVLVAVRDRAAGGVWIAADTRTKMSSSGQYRDLAGPKWIVRPDNGMAFAFAGYSAARVLAARDLRWDHIADLDGLADFAARVVRSLDIKPWYEDKESGLPGYGMHALLTDGERIIEMQSDLHCLEYREDYATSGSGCNEAIAALAALDGLCAPQVMSRRSVEIAAQYDCNVGGLWGPELILKAARAETDELVELTDLGQRMVPRRTVAA